MNEKISAFVDGEASREEDADFLTAIGQDQEARETFTRYQLVGALLRNECKDKAAASIKSGLADRIASRIEDEPEWLLPTSKGSDESVTSKPATTSDNVVQIKSRKPAFFGGFAAAAAISALAVFVVAPQWSVSQNSSELAELSPTPASTPVTQWQNESVSHEDRLNSFLVEHGEFTNSTGLNGLIAYAKFVSYDSTEQ